MLILTRKPGECIYIGDSIKVTVMEIKGNQIRVGIDAPQTLKIYREEIYLQILEENRSAAGVGDEVNTGLLALSKNSKTTGDDSVGGDGTLLADIPAGRGSFGKMTVRSVELRKGVRRKENEGERQLDVGVRRRGNKGDGGRDE